MWSITTNLYTLRLIWCPSLTGPPVSSQVVMGGKGDRQNWRLDFLSFRRESKKKRQRAKLGGLALWTDKDKIDGKKNINIRGNGEDPSFRD